jgi:hypothetical protein
MAESDASSAMRSSIHEIQTVGEIISHVAERPVFLAVIRGCRL